MSLIIEGYHCYSNCVSIKYKIRSIRSALVLYVVLFTFCPYLHTGKWNFSIYLENVSFLGNESPQHLQAYDRTGLAIVYIHTFNTALVDQFLY